jgi:hypothetical protein
VQEYAVHVLIAMRMIVVMAMMSMTVLEAENSDQVDCETSNADHQ